MKLSPSRFLKTCFADNFYSFFILSMFIFCVYVHIMFEPKFNLQIENGFKLLSIRNLLAVRFIA